MKKIHRAALFDPDGNISALCYRRPRAIRLSQASWTIVDEQVTCKRCLKAVQARTYCPPPADPDDPDPEEYPIK